MPKVLVGVLDNVLVAGEGKLVQIKARDGVVLEVRSKAGEEIGSLVVRNVGVTKAFIHIDMGPV